MIKCSTLATTLIVFVLGLASIAKSAPPVAKTTKPTIPTLTSAPVQQSYYADFDYELHTGPTSGGMETYKKGSESITAIGAQASVTKIIRNNIQAGAEAKFLNESGGGGSSYFQFMALGVYNFDNNLKESLYAKAGLGMVNIINDKFKNESKVAIMLGGGKRFLVMDKVAYTPEARVIMVDGSTLFQILALNFSLFY